VNHNIEEKLWPFNTEEALEDYEVSRTANGKKLRNSLNDSQNDGFEERDRIPLVLSDGIRSIPR
jgi:hypothetical protein